MTPRSFIIVCGAGTAGAAAASVAVDHGALVLVLEANARPYGHADRMPNWAWEARDEERAEIDTALDRPEVRFVPETAVGHGLAWSELLSLAPDAIIWATGDRPVDLDPPRGVVHARTVMATHARTGTSRAAAPVDGRGVIVIGDSPEVLNCARALLYDRCLEAFAARGRTETLNRLAGLGALEVCAQQGLTFEALGVAAPVIYCEGDGRALFGLGEGEFNAEMWFHAVESRDGIAITAGTTYVGPVVGDEACMGARFLGPDGQAFQTGAALVVDGRTVAASPADMPALPCLFIPVGCAAGLARDLDETRAETARAVVSLLSEVFGLNRTGSPSRDAMARWVTRRHEAVGYKGYIAWIYDHRP
jgi:hypothetical protein